MMLGAERAVLGPSAEVPLKKTDGPEPIRSRSLPK